MAKGRIEEGPCADFFFRLFQFGHSGAKRNAKTLDLPNDPSFSRYKPILIPSFAPFPVGSKKG